MSSTIDFNVKGISDPITVHGEYTDAIVNTFWAPRFETISEIFSNDHDETPFAVQDAEDLWNAVNELKDAAKNGIDTATGLPVPPGEEPEGRRFHLTIEMASSLDKLIKSLEAIGFDTVNPLDTTNPDLINQLLRWQDLNDVGLRETLVRMGNAISSNRTLQAMIELEYVKTGNELIGSELEQLDEALRITKDTLDTLGTAQELKNKLTAATRDVNDEDAQWFTFIPKIQEWDPPTVDVSLYGPPQSDDRQRAIDYNFAVNEYRTIRNWLNDLIDDPADNLGVEDGVFSTGEALIELWQRGHKIAEGGSVIELLRGARSALNGLVENTPLNDNLLITYDVPPLDEIPGVDFFSNMRGFADSAVGSQISIRMFENPLDFEFSSILGKMFKDDENFEADFANAMEKAFEEPLGIEFRVSADDVNQFVQVQNDLTQQRDLLKQINPDSPLIERLDTILSDMTEVPANGPIAMTDTGRIIGDNPENPMDRLMFWISDGYQNEDAIDAGINQRHITEAITDAQGLNDTQKEELRRQIYLFEQFYKSSSSILQAIDRMINKMASGIKG